MYVQIGDTCRFLLSLHIVHYLQVDVDSADIQKKLGNINMDFVRKAEKKNKERANMHRLDGLLSYLVGWRVNELTA